ncbi:MMPL family transporter [Paenibacillus sp. MER 99-2]|uniref:MMPL family transporter n=1 Tax=Paenibacillus sp. MER 99-2 TaxID=2939572 RepID=UPI002040E35B|nr:MMPL family transporter [Paenibacillus sp. MER 99-2]MCM3172568.1 MMPL family transporter [Paenibacillus sp. MER 99-2]
MGYRSLTVLVSRYPRFIIWCWLIIIGMSVTWAMKLPSVVDDHGLKLMHGDAHQVELMLHEQFNIPVDPVVVVFEKKKEASQAEFQVWIQAHLEHAQQVPGVHAIISPLELRGAHMLREDIAYALLELNATTDQKSDVIQQLHSVLTEDNTGTVQLTGKPVVQQDVNRLSFRDLEHAEVVGVPLALIILWFAFRGWNVALIAVMMGISSVVIAMGVTTLIGHQVELSNFIINVIPMVGMALSIDFALIILSRYREELSKVRDMHSEVYREVLQRTMQTAGRAVLFSAACVFLGLLGLLWIRLPMFMSVSLGAITVLIIAVLLNITLLPAILSLYANLIFKHIKISSSQLSDQGSSMWRRWSGAVMKRPIRMVIIGTVALLLCVLPVSKLDIAVPDATSLPIQTESRQAMEKVQSVFGQGEVSSVDLVIGGTDKSLSKAHWNSALYKFQELRQDPNVVDIDSPWRQMNPGVVNSVSTLEKLGYVSDRAIRIKVTVKGEPGSDQVAAWIERMYRHDAVNGVKQGVPIHYGGEAVDQYEIMKELVTKLPKVIVFVVVSNYMVMLVAFRSLIIPIKAIVMNILSLIASFGILVMIFNQGHWGMEPSPIAIMIPVFIAGLVFGISMDYGVFMLTRIQEAYRRTGDSDLAVQEGLSSTGRLITSAAAILLAVTIPFAFGDVAGVKQLGIGITAAVLIDVTIIRLLLVPALMKLMGRWNWWFPGQTNKL